MRESEGGQVDNSPILWYISLSKTLFDSTEKALKIGTFSVLSQVSKTVRRVDSPRGESTMR